MLTVEKCICGGWMRLRRKLNPGNNFSFEEVLTEQLKGKVEFIFSEDFKHPYQYTSYFFHLLNPRIIIEFCIDDTKPETIYYRILEKSKDKHGSYEVQNAHLYKKEEAEKIADLTKTCLDTFVTHPSIRLLEITGLLNYEYSGIFNARSHFSKEMQKLLAT